MKGKSEGDTRKPIIVANTRPSNHWGGNVYSIDGISPTLTSGSTIKNGLKIMDNRKIKKVGNINPNKPHQSGDVYNIHGLSRTLSATDSKHPCYITEGNKVGRIKDNRKIKLIKSYNGHQSGNIYDKNGLSPSLCCTDYKAPVKIVEDRGGNSMDNNIIKDNFTEVEEGKYVTTDRERELLCDYHSPTKPTTA